MSVQASSLMAAIAAVTSLVWRTVTENRMPWRRQAPKTLRPEPRVAPQRQRPGSPARRTRPANSLTNRSAPRAVLAAPVRIPRCRISPVSALLASSGW
jgi:hypothetical protein